MVVRAWPLVLLVTCALPAPALAQSDAPPGDEYAMASPPDRPLDAAAADAAKNAGADLSLGDALNLDAAALAATPVKRLRLPGYVEPQGFDVSRSDKPDGSGTFTVKRPLPIDVETKLGADFVPPPNAIFAPGQPLPGSSYDSGVAWASVGVPNLASIDARVDPDGDRSKLGTTLQRAVPIGRELSVTLQDTFSVTDTMSIGPGAAASEPLLAALPPSTPAPAQVWGNEKKLKFDILPTGTSLSGGVITSSIDPQTHNTFSADQKIYGPLHVTTTVNDVGEATGNKSITAGFKLNW